MGEAKRFSEMKQKYQDFKPFLAGDKIFLWGVDAAAKPLERFDTSLLEELLKYYTELDQIEEKVTPRTNQYLNQYEITL
jgi:hypothetical protein